jgi:hypothetical protein
LEAEVRRPGDDAVVPDAGGLKVGVRSHADDAVVPGVGGLKVGPVM